MQDPTDEASGAQDQTERGRRVLAYHSRSKHHPNRYAPSPGRLDWANQPDPFRTYAGAPAVELPLLADAIATPYGDLYEPGAVRPRRAGSPAGIPQARPSCRHGGELGWVAPMTAAGWPQAWWRAGNGGPRQGRAAPGGRPSLPGELSSQRPRARRLG